MIIFIHHLFFVLIIDNYVIISIYYDKRENSIPFILNIQSYKPCLDFWAYDT